MENQNMENQNVQNQNMNVSVTVEHKKSNASVDLRIDRVYYQHSQFVLRTDLRRCLGRSCRPQCRA